MITKKIGIIGCGNMGGAILYGALESGVLPKENAYVYDISPAMMEKAEKWGVHLAANDEDVCRNADIVLLAVYGCEAAKRSRSTVHVQKRPGRQGCDVHCGRRDR